MNHIFVLKAAHHMDNCVALAYIGEELVAEAFAFAGTAHKSRDVDKFDDCGRHLFGVVHFAEGF